MSVNFCMTLFNPHVMGVAVDSGERMSLVALPTCAKRNNLGSAVQIHKKAEIPSYNSSAVPIHGLVTNHPPTFNIDLPWLGKSGGSSL